MKKISIMQAFENLYDAARELLQKDKVTEADLLTMLTSTGNTIEKGQGIREEYESRKYKKGTRWLTGNNKSLRKRGIGHVWVEVLGTYKTYSSSGFTNYTIHVKVLEGEKLDKEYRLSNIALYKIEELT